jgi:hypothetical protein
MPNYLKTEFVFINIVTHMLTTEKRLGKHFPEVSLSTTELTSIARQRLANTLLSKQVSATTNGCYGIDARLHSNG